MTTIRCNRCGKTFEAANGARAEQALRMHVARVHDRTMRTPTKTDLLKKAQREARLQYSRHYRKHGPKRKGATGTGVEVHVNFCPNCGCNLTAVATGLALAART